MKHYKSQWIYVCKECTISFTPENEIKSMKTDVNFNKFIYTIDNK